MQFSHVVVHRPSTVEDPVPGSERVRVRGMQPIWRCSSQSKQDWAMLHACQQGHFATVQALVWRGARVGLGWSTLIVLRWSLMVSDGL
jgi:hypothetical protein